MPKRPHALFTVSLAVSLAAGAPALAADRTVPLKFGSGHAYATKKGTIRGYDGVSYVFEASAGRTVSMLFSPSNRSCYFNLARRGDDEAIFVGSSSGNEFAGVLAKDGSDSATVYLMRNAARRHEACRYSITIEFAP